MSYLEAVAARVTDLPTIPRADPLVRPADALALTAPGPDAAGPPAMRGEDRPAPPEDDVHPARPSGEPPAVTSLGRTPTGARPATPSAPSPSRDDDGGADRERPDRAGSSDRRAPTPDAPSRVAETTTPVRHEIHQHRHDHHTTVEIHQVRAAEQDREPPVTVEPAPRPAGTPTAPAAATRPVTRPHVAAPPGDRAEPPPPPQRPTVEVRIGRVVVTAPPGRDRPRPRPDPPRTATAPRVLADYLDRRGDDGGRR